MTENPGTMAGITILGGAAALLLGILLFPFQRPMGAFFSVAGILLLGAGFWRRSRILKEQNAPAALPHRDAEAQAVPKKPQAETPRSREKMNLSLMAQASQLPGDIPPAGPTKLPSEPSAPPAARKKPKK